MRVESQNLQFFRLDCGCVVLLAMRDGARHYRLVVKAENCNDLPEDKRFHCWRYTPETLSCVADIPVAEVVSARLFVETAR